MTVAGCGGSSTTTTSATSTSSAASTLEREIAASGAKQFDAIGRAQVLRSSCRPVRQQYTCQMLYDFTRPTGQRVELAMTLPASCAGQRCAVNWSAGGGAHVVRKLGLDPRSHVAICERALKAAVETFSTRATSDAAAACKGVHNGVYTGR